MKVTFELVFIVLLLNGQSLKVALSDEVKPGLYNPGETFNHQVEIESFNPINKTLRASILNVLLAEFEEVKDVIADKMKCGALGNWRKIAYFDTTQGDSCPTGLRTVTNTTTNQIACGRTNSALGCTVLTFPSGGTYTNVCGRVRAYQYYNTAGFYSYTENGQETVNSSYVDGISITQDSFNNHLWTYAAGTSETRSISRQACPCARPAYQSVWIPIFLENNYYCESGVFGKYEPWKIYWGDPLLDGSGCHAKNTCCEHFGWFYRIVSPSTFDIEVRWCGQYANFYTDVPTDQLEIWVM